LHKRFYSEDKLNVRVILSSVLHSAVARLFVLAAVDEYIRVQCNNVEWHQAVVIFNHEIENSALVVRNNQHPYLMQAFSSSFWLYNNSSIILVTDDIYLAIAAWFFVLHHEYDAILLRRSLLFFTKECLKI
jgi:hypothetical protein